MYADPLLLGVPIAVLTALVVEALKRAGLAKRLTPVAAICSAAILAELAELAMDYGWAESVSRVVVAGIMIGLASSGGYSWVREMGKE